MTDPPAAPTVAVCIASFRRPDGLRDLLASLDRQTGLDGHAVRVVVVDNDPDGSAGEAIDWAIDNTDLDLVTEIERRPGVSHARNRSIALAEGCEFVAVIDDDMTAEPDWLASLLAAQSGHDADAVGGWVARSIDDPGRQWVVDLDLFAPLAEGEEGAEVQALELGSSLIRREILGDRPFDPALGEIGGEDTKLFLTLSLDGYRIVTTRTARAHEVIAAERGRLGWMTRRAFRLGSCWSMIERSQKAMPPARRAALAAARIGRGMVKSMTGVLVFSRRRVVDGLLDACTGVGGLAGLAGVTISEYDRRGHRLVRIDVRDLAG